MTKEEWKELNALKAAISDHPSYVVPEQQERFTKLLVKSWSYVNAVPGVDSLLSVPSSCKNRK